MDKELLNKLKISGLTKREAHIYLALLQKKEFTASEIASMVPIGRTKIYEIIPRLLSLGFCNEIQKNGKKIYSAVSPKIALKNLLSSSKQELEEMFHEKEQMLVEKISVINELENKLSSIYSNNVHKSDGIDYIEVVRDINQIRKKWIQLQKNTKSEILDFNKPPYSVSFEDNVNNQKALFKRGVAGKSIYEYCENTSGISRGDFIKILEAYKNIGEESRVIDELPMKLVIIDEKITMLALNDPVSMQPSITTMIVNHPSFAKAQKQVFNSYWQIAVPLEDFKKREKKEFYITDLINQ